eukprot:2687408-Alexandrium_andersonii.AAC.1
MWRRRGRPQTRHNCRGQCQAMKVRAAVRRICVPVPRCDEPPARTGLALPARAGTRTKARAAACYS